MKQIVQKEEVSLNQSSIQSPKGIVKQHRFMESSPDQKQKLIQQNIRLKTKLFELSQQLDRNVINKQFSKKYGSKDTDDEFIKAKKLELKKQQMEVINIRSKINIIKRQLQTVYNNRKLLAKEDTLKQLRSQLQNLNEEKKSLIKIKQEQTRALRIVRTEQQIEQKIRDAKKQLQSVKQETKNLNEKIMQLERVLRKNHQSYIVKQNKLREIENKLKHSKQGNIRINNQTEHVTHQMIKQLEQEVNQLENIRKQNEQSWHLKLSNLEKDLQEKQSQQERRLLLLKEKQKQLRLSEIKIKQLKKVQKDKKLAESRSVEPIDIDMHQFRYKRNIKYMGNSDN